MRAIEPKTPIKQSTKLIQEPTFCKTNIFSVKRTVGTKDTHDSTQTVLCEVLFSGVVLQILTSPHVGPAKSLAS